MSDFLGLAGKKVVVTGVAGRRSIAHHVAQALEQCGAEPVYVVQSEAVREAARQLFGERDVFVCDVQRQEDVDRLREDLAAHHPRVAGLVHSIAFANYSEGPKPFHSVPRADFLQAVDVSCYSLVALSNALRELFERTASVVTMSISTTRLAAENYGYMAPIKAALDSTVVFLAKSFSRFSEVRFNAVRSGPLKTASSAGIPGFVESYMFATRATLRGRALETREVADTALFLLSPRSSGINAQGIVVDAGMGVNLFDEQIVRRVVAAEGDGA